MLVVLVIRTMQALKVFDIIYMLTHGGPANGTMVISYFIYNQSFAFMHFSYGVALAIIVAVISTIITVLYVKNTEDRRYLLKEGRRIMNSRMMKRGFKRVGIYLAAVVVFALDASSHSLDVYFQHYTHRGFAHHRWKMVF